MPLTPTVPAKRIEKARASDGRVCLWVAISVIHRRIRRLGYETVGTMKALFSIFLALGVCIGSIQAGPVRTARNVAKNTAITAKNVAHTTVKGTRRPVHTVVNKVTP